MVLPAAVLVVSGGHTEVVLMHAIGKYERLGWTLDDAAGECFDKTAKLLGLPYPGGPAIDKAAAAGQPGRFTFPRPLERDPRVIFSFSGLKTAVRTQVMRMSQPLTEEDVADISLALREAVVDVLLARLIQAAREHDVQAIYLAGGVAANRLLRERTASEAARLGLKFRAPEPIFCTDNAAMIACAGQARLAAGFSDPLTLDSFARRPLASWR